MAITPRQVQGGSRNYPVKIRLEATPGVEFHPGMSCRAEVSTKKDGGAKTLAVPVQAVKYEEPEKKDGKADKGDKGKASVFIIVDGKAVKREVETGIADDSYIEILKGVKEDESVIIGPSKVIRFLKDGEKVEANVAVVDKAKEKAAGNPEVKAPTPTAKP